MRVQNGVSNSPKWKKDREEISFGVLFGFHTLLPVRKFTFLITTGRCSSDARVLGPPPDSVSVCLDKTETRTELDISILDA